MVLSLLPVLALLGFVTEGRGMTIRGRRALEAKLEPMSFLEEAAVLGTVFDVLHVEGIRYPGNLTAIVTHAGKRDLTYIDSAVMLGMSIQKHVPGFPMVAIVVEGMKSRNQQLLRNAGWAIAPVPDWEFDRCGVSCGLHDNFEKVNAFRLPFQRALFLDAETYVFSPKLRNIMDMHLPPGHIAMAMDGCKSEYNSGVALYRPDLAVFNQMLSMVPSHRGPDNILGRNLISEVYSGKVVEMPNEFNCVDIMAQKRPGRKTSCKFCGRDAVVSRFIGASKIEEEGMLLEFVRRPISPMLACPNTSSGSCSKWSEYYCDMRKHSEKLSSDLQLSLEHAGLSQDRLSCKECRPAAVVLSGSKGLGTPEQDVDGMFVKTTVKAGELHGGKPIYMRAPKSGETTGMFLYYIQQSTTWLLGRNYSSVFPEVIAYAEAECPGDAGAWHFLSVAGNPEVRPAVRCREAQLGPEGPEHVAFSLAGGGWQGQAPPPEPEVRSAPAISLRHSVAAHASGAVPPSHCSERRRPGDAYAVAIVFAGRRKYMRLLVAYLDRLVEECSLDEVHLWNFVKFRRDWEWLEDMSESRPAYQLMRAKVREARSRLWKTSGNYRPPDEFAWQNDQWNYAHRFYSSGDGNETSDRFVPRWPGATRDNTVLLKMDDDIVYIDTLGFPSFTRYVRDHPEKFIVHANIVNNPVTAYYQAHHLLRLRRTQPELLQYPIRGSIPGTDGDLLLGSTSIVSELHKMFTSNPAAFSWNESTTGDSCIVYRMPREDFYSSPTTLTKYTTYTQLQLAFNRSQGRLCINFFGARWAAWDTAWNIIEKYKVVDEEALTVWATSTEHGLEECIYTPFNVAHYASHSQRDGGYTDEDLRLYEDLLARETEEAGKVVDTMGPGETRKVEEVKKAMEDRKVEEARKAKDAEKAEAKTIEEAKRAEEAAAREKAERKAREDAAADKAEREAREFGAEFVIELDMTEGHSIGAVLYSRTDHDPLVVSKWNGGSPVEAWNRAHPDRAVQVGDEISKVSDIAWDHHNREFLHSLKEQAEIVSGTKNPLELVIKRRRPPEVR